MGKAHKKYILEREKKTWFFFYIHQPSGVRLENAHIMTRLYRIYILLDRSPGVRFGVDQGMNQLSTSKFATSGAMRMHAFFVLVLGVFFCFINLASL